MDHFLNFYTIIGKPEKLPGCILGLEKNNEAIVTSQIFTLIWSGMYDLVYYSERSRIAEKMLEKATLYAYEKDQSINAYFSSIEEYVKLYDDMLLDNLVER